MIRIVLMDTSPIRAMNISSGKTTYPKISLEIPNVSVKKFSISWLFEGRKSKQSHSLTTLTEKVLKNVRQFRKGLNCYGRFSRIKRAMTKF
jgi:hypothetical protein